jgi:UDP-N-acetylmuramoyl-tripeptide--D-alanyl-D-alanine ligase
MLKQIIARLILHYFRFLAKVQLSKNPQATIIGITGSAGKTSTRLAMVQILKSRGVVKQTEGANSESGIPLDILGLRPKNYSLVDWVRLIILAPIRVLTFAESFDYYVVEMGIDSPDAPKNMSYLLSILTPNVGIVLNAGLAHTANFDYLVKDNNPERRKEKLVSLVAKEKMGLARGLAHKGVAIINLDQKELAHNLKEVEARKITYGKSAKADVKITNIATGSHGLSFSFSYLGSRYVLSVKDILPDHYAYTFAAAIASSSALGIPPSLSTKALENYRAPAGRMRVFPGINNTTIIDSSYNASPSSMLESLKLLKKIGSKHRKIAVLGDMRELGVSAKLAHKDLAQWAGMYADEILLFGELTKEFTQPLLESKKIPVTHFDEMSHLIKYLKSRLKSNAYILVKGSQNEIFLERAVEAILRNKSDITNLCRRGQYWDSVRRKAV